MLSGHVSPDDLPGVLEFLKLGRKTGLLMIDGARFQGGFVALSAGEAVHARAGAFEGQEAFARLLDAASGVFAFYQGEGHQGEGRELPRTLTAPLDHLLMEAAVWRDHHARDREEELQAPGQPVEESVPAGDDDLPTLDLTGPREQLGALLANRGVTAPGKPSSPGALMDEAFTEAVRAHVAALAPECAESVLRAALRSVQAEDGRVTKTNAPAFLREVYAKLPGEARTRFMRVIPTLTSKYAAHKQS